MSAPMPAPHVEQADHCACNASDPVVPDAEVGGTSPIYAWGGPPLVIGAGTWRQVALPSLYVYQVPFRGGDPAWTIVATARSSKSLNLSLKKTSSPVPPVPGCPAGPPAPPSVPRLRASHAPRPAATNASAIIAVRPIAHLLT